MATPGSAMALLVPQVQQTRNVSPPGLVPDLSWPQRELRMQEEQPSVSHAQLSLSRGAGGLKLSLAQVTKCFQQLCR